jgi:phospholipase C
MIEWRWDLPPLTVRDAGANNLALALDFRAPSLRAAQFAVPSGPFGAACPLVSAAPVAPDEWAPLLEMAESFGWPV